MGGFGLSLALQVAVQNQLDQLHHEVQLLGLAVAILSGLITVLVLMGIAYLLEMRRHRA